MSSQSILRIVDSDTADALPFERRASVRYMISGSVTAVRTPTAQDPPQTSICSFELQDISDIGIGVLTQESIELGTEVSIFFPPHGPERGFDLSGHVVRCSPCEQGHDVGISLRKKAAA